MKDEEKVILKKEEALNISKIKDNQIHNFINATFGLIGADYDKETFEEYLENAERIEVGGNICRRMGHALVVIRNNETYFFEHSEEKLKELLKEKGADDEENNHR